MCGGVGRMQGCMRMGPDRRWYQKWDLGPAVPALRSHRVRAVPKRKGRRIKRRNSDKRHLSARSFGQRVAFRSVSRRYRLVTDVLVKYAPCATVLVRGT